MPTRNQSGKPSHAFQNPNKKRKKSWKKIEKLYDWYVLVQRKALNPSMQNRAEKTMKLVNARAKKYSISTELLQKYAAKKGL